MRNGIDYKALVKGLADTDLIVTPKMQEWLLTHGDDVWDEVVADRIRELMLVKPRVRSASLSASSGGQCVRQQALQYLGASGGVTDVRLANIFMDGKWRHLRWQAMCLAAGILTDAEDPQSWPKMRMVGTMDGSGVVPMDHPRTEWRGEEFGFELKGVSGYMFPKMRDSGPNEATHLRQVARYFLMTGFKLFSIVYEDKSTQEWKEWVVDSESDQMQRLMNEERGTLQWLNKSIDDRKLPPKLAPCAKQKGEQWRSCPMGGDDGSCLAAGEWPSPGQAGFVITG